MKKYRVVIPFPVWVSVVVEADTPEEAEEVALGEVYLDQYAGNGGTDKIIGVRNSNMSVEAGECPIENCDGFPIDTQEISE